MRKMMIFVMAAVILSAAGCKDDKNIGEWSTVVTETQTTTEAGPIAKIDPQKTNVKDAPDIPSVDQVFWVDKKEKEWTDMETQWRIHVLEPTKEEIEEYIQACINYGFNCNANMSDHFLYAETADAEWSISVQYFEKDIDDPEDVSWSCITLEKLDEPEVSMTEN